MREFYPAANDQNVLIGSMNEDDSTDKTTSYTNFARESLKR